MPVQRAAAQFGVSDVALAKACRRQQVPLPPRGYWARKAAGQAVSPPPLPDYIPPPPAPKRLSAYELRELERQREAEEHARSIAERFADLPLVCFADDVAKATGISKKRLDALLREGASPIPELPYFGLLQRAWVQRYRNQTHEARPCWSKKRVLEFLLKDDWERATRLELPSERVARTCTHCPVHCPAHHEHSYSRRWKNSWWRNQ